jgi:hypothetical protein
MPAISSGIGRFVSADSLVPDPTAPQSYNRYSYTRNNPLNRIDPSGHQDLDCGLSECGFEGTTWIGQWIGWGETAIPAVGISASASLDTPLVSLEMGVGAEVVFDMDKGEMTSFLVIGGDISVGPNTGWIDWLKRLGADKSPSPINRSMSIYAAGVHNVDTVVEDYSGPFLYKTTTATVGYGGTFGEAYSPNDPDRERAYSDTVGVATGYALTVNNGVSYYFPMQTHNLATGTTTYYNPLPYLQDFSSMLKDALNTLHGE